MNYNKFLLTTSIFGLSLFVVLFMLGLFFYFQRAAHVSENSASKQVDFVSEESVPNTHNRFVNCPTDFNMQKVQIQASRLFLLLRDYENAYTVLCDLEDENDLATDDRFDISYALIYTCLMLDKYDEAIVLSNRFENEFQFDALKSNKLKLLNVLVHVYLGKYGESIEKLTQIEGDLKNDIPVLLFVFWTRSAIYLSQRRYEQAKVDFENLSRIAESDELPDVIRKSVIYWRECYNLCIEHPEDYVFVFDNTLPHPEKSATDEEKIDIAIILRGNILSTVDGIIIFSSNVGF